MTDDRDARSRREVIAGLSALLLPLGATRATAAAPASSGGSPEPTTLLRAAPAKTNLLPDATAPADIWAFDGRLPGPVIRVKQGEAVFARLLNQTTAPLSLHWQGVRGPNAMDGAATITQVPVPPGGQFDYRFTPPDAGTFLVRPLVPGGTSEATGRGLGALLVVEEREPPQVDADLALLVRDWRLGKDGALEPFGNAQAAALAGRLGNRLDVAGEGAPNRVEQRPGARIRLRLANAANARIMRIRFDNLKVYVAAVDGQPSESFEPLRATLPFAPGSRYDLFVDLPAEAGQQGRVVALIGDGLPLIEITTKGEPIGARPTVKALPANPLLPPEIKLQNAVRRDVVLTGGAKRGADGQPVYAGDPRTIWMMNGQPGSAESPPMFKAPRGAPVVLGITNQTGFPQPIHLHGHVFRLLHALDDGWEPYWLDTFQVPEGKTLHIAFIADNPGKWMLSSTVAERFDTGLWSWFEVA